MKILLISYYFPPCGGAPVQRWLRLLPYLTQKGHKVTVICSKDGDYPFIDERLIKLVPPSVKIIRVRALGMAKIWNMLSGSKSRMPYGSIPQKSSLIAQLLIWLRLNLIIPDLRVLWNAAAKKAALSELSKIPYDLMISTGPPHSSHLIAISIAQSLRIRWFADFRDPMSKIHYLRLHPPSRFAMRKLERMEKEIVSSADQCLVVSSAISDALPVGKKLVIHNGYEARDFEGIIHTKSPIMRIKYVGQITAGQDIRLFAELLRDLRRDYRLSMIGTQLSEDDQALLHQACGDKLRIKSFVPHDQAIKEMVDSDLLLLIINRLEDNQGILTTKLFEYLASRSPILCLGSEDTAAAAIIKDSGAGQSFDYHEIARAKQWLSELPKGLRTSGRIDHYCVARQADILLDAIDSKIGVDK